MEKYRLPMFETRPDGTMVRVPGTENPLTGKAAPITRIPERFRQTGEKVIGPFPEGLTWTRANAPMKFITNPQTGSLVRDMRTLVPLTDWYGAQKTGAVPVGR